MNTFEKFYAGKKILVTGGAGFIGSNIVEQLVELDADVTVLDNLSTGTRSNLEHLTENIDFIVGDIRNTETCMKAVEGSAIILHLAAFVSVPESVEKPKECAAINIEGTRNLCEAAARHNVTSFIFSSSSAVYGQRTSVCTESDELNPLSPYALSKMEGEKLCRKLAESTGISTTSLRYFNVYGPRQNPDGHYAAVVAKFTEKLKAGAPILMYGDGMQTRDFVPVEKVVRANLATGMLPDSCGDVINVASGTSINLFQLLEKLEHDTGYKRNDITFLPAREGDILHSEADCSKLRDLLGGKKLVSNDTRVQKAFEAVLQCYNKTLRKT